MIVVSFFLSSGEIINTFQVADFISPPLEETLATGIGFIKSDSEDIKNKYVQNNQLCDRPALNINMDRLTIQANSDEFVTISSLPSPCDICYSGPGFIYEQTTSDTMVELTTDIVGTHRVEIKAWPYLDWETTFNAY